MLLLCVVAVPKLTDNASILRLFVAFSIPMPIDIKCDGCESAVSTLFCEQCNAYYCAACDGTAHAVKNARSHVRVSSNACEHGRVYFCANHSGKRADLFCNDCSELICLLCRDYGTHSGHNVDLIENTSQNLRDVLTRQVGSVTALTTTARETLVKVDATLADLHGGAGGGACQVAKADIDSHFDKVVNALRERRAQLLKSVDELAAAKQDRLRQQSVELQQTIRADTEVLEKIRASCQLDDYSVCNNYAETINILENLKKSASKSIVPVADTEIPVSFDDTFLDTLRNHSTVGGPLRVRFSSAANGVYAVEWDEPMRSEHRRWTSYVVKCRMLSKAADIPESSLGASWTRVGGLLEKTLGEVSAPTQRLTAVLSEYPGATMDFLVQAIDNMGRSSAWAVSPQKLRLPLIFSHKTFHLIGEPFSSKNGLLYHLGTRGGTSTYENPHTIGAVTASWSSIGGGSVEQFVNNDAGADFCYTDDSVNSWMCVDLGSDRLFRPTAYSLRHDLQGPRGVLRNWLFQAKMHENDEWVTISRHIDDKSIRCLAGSVASFTIDNDGMNGYRYFRILQNGKNSSDKNRLLCSGLELFGTLY